MEIARISTPEARWIERQYQVVIHVEKDHRAILKLLTNDPIRRQTHTIAVEGKRSFKIAHAQRKNLDP
jgi:hypothetical protein